VLSSLVPVPSRLVPMSLIFGVADSVVLKYLDAILERHFLFS